MILQLQIRKWEERKGCIRCGQCCVWSLCGFPQEVKDALVEAGVSPWQIRRNKNEDDECRYSIRRQKRRFCKFLFFNDHAQAFCALFTIPAWADYWHTGKCGFTKKEMERIGLIETPQ